MGNHALLFNHTHTPDSNRFEREVRSLAIDSHATDYPAIVRALPDTFDAVFVKTDHWKTDPAYFDRLESEVARFGGSSERFESHLWFELDGSAAAVINGVEASFVSTDYHVTIGGLPLTDEETYTSLSIERLLEVGADAGWIAPAHVGMPFHRVPDAVLDDLFTRAATADVTTALGYATGYPPFYNRLSRSDLPFRTSVREFGDRYDVPLVPELDLHGVVPDGYSGCGLLDASVVGKLRDGALPTGDILAADLFRPEGFRNGLRIAQFLRNYAVFVPLVSPASDRESRFDQSIPATERVRSIDVGASQVSP